MDRNIFLLNKNEDGVLVFSKLLRRIYLLEEELFNKLDAGEENSTLDAVGLTLERVSSESKKSTRTITFFPTTNCNLSCKYCYADANQKHLGLDFNSAKSLLDHFVSESLNKLNINFHGGGEPSLAMSLIKRITRYAQSKFDNVKTHMTSNGTFNTETLEWILDNISSINISCDGPYDIQKMQRPSYRDDDKLIKRVYYNIENLPKPAVRATITTFSVNRQAEIVEFFHSLGVKKIRFEPLARSKRSDRMGLELPDLTLFSEKYLEALDTAHKLGVYLSSTFLDFDRCVTRFCGATNNNICLTPDNYLTACYEVTQYDAYADPLIIGQVKNNQVLLFEDKINYLKSRTTNNLSECSSCIAELQCGGGCLMRSLQNEGDIFKVYSDYCDTRKGLFMSYLTKQSEKMK